MRLALIALAWCIGIGLSSTPVLDDPRSWWMLCGIGGAMVWWFWSARGLRLPAVLVLVMALGGLRAASAPTTATIATFNDTAGIDVYGVVVSEPVIRDDGRLTFILDAETVNHGDGMRPITGRVQVVALPPPTPPRYGDRVLTHGTPITPPRIDTFDYAAFLARAEIYTLLRDATVQTDETTSPADAGLAARLIDFKDRLRDLIGDALPYPAAALMRGVLFGDDALPDPMRDDFAAAGTAHVIAVSGFNMTIAGTAVRGLLRRMGTGGRTAAAGALIVVLLYALMAGMTGGVFRAWVMTSLVIAADLLRRRTFAPASLGLAVIVFTLIDPRDLADVSFQLSALAVLGLAVLSAPLTTGIQRGLYRVLPGGTARQIGGLAAEWTATSLAAWAFTAPLIAFYFGTLSVVSLPANVLIAPLQPLILLMGGVGSLIGLIMPVLGEAVLLLVLPALSWTMTVSAAFARLPFAQYGVFIDQTGIIVITGLLMGGVMLAASRPVQSFSRLVTGRAALLCASVTALAIIIVVSMIVSRRPDGQLHVWALEMDGRTAILVQSPGGAHILIDGGASPRRLLSALGERLPLNKRALDLLIVTTPSEWQTRGLAGVLDFYAVHSALLPPLPVNDAHTRALFDRLPTARTVQVSAGHSVRFDDGLEIEIVHPHAEQAASVQVSEEAAYGLVLRLRYGTVSFLITGALDRDGQRVLRAAGQTDASLPATVLHVPALGANLDADFLRSVGASAAFITGRTGLPVDTDALAVLGDIPIWHTDERGDLHWWTDGNHLWACGAGTSCAE